MEGWAAHWAPFLKEAAVPFISGSVNTKDRRKRKRKKRRRRKRQFQQKAFWQKEEEGGRRNCFLFLFFCTVGGWLGAPGGEKERSSTRFGCVVTAKLYKVQPAFTQVYSIFGCGLRGRLLFRGYGT